MPAISNELIKQASEAYHLSSDSFQLVEDASNPSYFVEYQGKSAFLRMSSRPKNMILGEIDFMRYLSRNGIRVSEIYPAKNGDVTAQISDDSQSYTLTLFEKLPGEHPEGDLLTEDVLRLWGRTLGKMHRLGADYLPASSEIRRPAWYEIEAFDVLERIPEDQSDIREKCETGVAKIRRISEIHNADILLHADAEPWNVLLHKNSLGWIDFDECCYFHPAFDLAVSMMYILIASVDDVLNPDNAEKNKSAQRVWSQLYQGYREENSLSDEQLALIPDYLYFRVMQSYAHNYIVFDFDNLLDWQEYVHNYFRRIILNEEEFLKVDWV